LGRSDVARAPFTVEWFVEERRDKAMRIMAEIQLQREAMQGNIGDARRASRFVRVTEAFRKAFQRKVAHRVPVLVEIRRS